jgi:hypothetical protein
MPFGFEAFQHASCLRVHAVRFLLGGKAEIDVDQCHSRLSPSGPEWRMKRGELMCTAILEEESTVTSRTTCLDMNLIEEPATCREDRSDAHALKTMNL